MSRAMNDAARSYCPDLLRVLADGEWRTMHQIRTNFSRVFNPESLLAAVRILEGQGKVETISGWKNPPFRVRLRKEDTPTTRVRSATATDGAGDH